MGSLDRAIFNWINRWPDSLSPVFLFFSESNKWWSVRIMLAAAAAILLFRKDTRRGGLCALIAWPIANFAADLFKYGFQIARPSVDLYPNLMIRVDRLTSFGTVSAHAASMSAVAFALTYHFGWKGAIWILVAFLTGLSRIYVGVHYPSQVLYGWLLGTAISAAICLVPLGRTPSLSVKPRFRGP